jgi:hypothetical protein
MSHSKVPWLGRVISIQPRIRLLRSFDERTHTYLGYVLVLEGGIGGEPRAHFLVAIGPKAQEEFHFRIGDEVRGQSHPVEDPELEIAGYYRTSGVEIMRRGTVPGGGSQGPPFHDAAPSLDEYRARGHRRLDAGTYESKCTTCVWGCRMPVEIIRDNWNRSRGTDNVTRRMETFCYGPDDCVLYKAGPKRKVRGRRGLMHQDDGNSRM